MPEVSMPLPFDPEYPPAQPPTGCADPLLWHVAWGLHRAHRLLPTSDRACLCGLRHPCWGNRLALRGLVHACVPGGSPQWIDLVRRT
jgi:hypothetical protein